VTAVRRVVAAAGLAGVLAACGSGTSSPTASHPVSGPVASPPHVIATPTGPSTPAGSPAHPIRVTPTRALLDWHPVPGSTKDLVTVGDGWTLTVPAGNGEARLSGPHPHTFPAGPHSSISDAFLDGAHALIVSEDRFASAPDRAVVVDLASGRTTTLDRTSSPATVVGGTWALGPDSLVHATSGPHHSYCLATVDLSTGHGSTGWCAEPRHGFSRASVTENGTSMMTFDAHHPSCRTLVQVFADQVMPIPGVTTCKGWDSALVDGTTIWSVVPKDQQIEAAHFYAHTQSGWYDLGPGTSGSLVTCDRSAYFTRDPGSRTDPATLLRWSPVSASLTVAFASKGTGNAFLAPPRCGGNHLTVTAYEQAGDQQVTAKLD
jgi:hypothetical protein